MQPVLFILTIFSLIHVIRTLILGIRKIFNPALTGAAVTHYISHCVKTREFGEFRTPHEEIFEFGGLDLLAHFKGHEVKGLQTGLLVEFKVYPNSTGRLSASSRLFVFIRSHEHLLMMKERLLVLEKAQEEMQKSIKAGLAPHEEAALGREIAEINGRFSGAPLEESAS